MKSKKSYKFLWNVFLFVICGGALIFGFVQERRAMRSYAEAEECRLLVDSLKRQVELQQIEADRQRAIAVANEQIAKENARKAESLIK